jgi:regulator of protease activity HflC (stomatin/prohibitin superfamily)
MMEIDTQEIITEDNLNAKVDLVVYYKVVEEEKEVKKSVYKVSDFVPQITRLAQTTARNVIGTMVFKDVNSQRNKLNSELAKILKTETSNWGVEIVRVELKDITPPEEVQDTMNQVIQAENTKRAAIDYATATETKADGEKRAVIKKAEGDKQMKILIAEGAAKAYKLVNESFKGNAQLLKKLEVTQIALQNNAKIVLTEKGITPQLILGEIPTRRGE